MNRFRTAMPGPEGEIKHGSALYILIESMAEEISQLSYHVSANNTHVHTVAGHETSFAQEPSPKPPEVPASPEEEKKPELPLAASDFMPELKKV